MDDFYVINFTRKRRFILIGMISLLVATIFFIQSSGNFLWLQDSDDVAITKGNVEESNIALTFNISWGEEKVHDILDELSKEDVQATFFLSGEWAERHPAIVEKITENQHEIGMLGYRYKSYLEQELSQVQSDLILAKEVFGKIGFDDMKLLRTPSGQFNEEVLELAKSMDFDVVHWNINPNDWENPGTEKIINTVMKETTNGDVVLLHASDSVKQTAAALETILPGLKNKGFTFVPISELISQVDTEIKSVD